MTKQATEDYIIHKNGRTFKSRKVGFIGLGKMGSAMAGHLARAGHIVHVFNRSKKKADNWIKAFESYSVSEINSLDLMGQACEIIISCVGDDDDLRDITFSPTGCFQTMQKNTIFIDHSTTSFDVAQEVNRFAVERSITFLMRLYLVEHLERKMASCLLCSEAQKNIQNLSKISSVHTRKQRNEWVMWDPVNLLRW